ncbi:DWNN-domain-containing protein [Punctularia strigosozonata HHB-11173 SS5]|uniref:DWNN-domain-containing protein n=1 Tax=Punctularia strigosozonata (strain HHB-11173) TaxID=741275 RepID=UPI00044173C6|nr:DWNN-domain-containing protein [Punctularia strigosozonata HHB-11173 SS5]EIN06104.1 DWNN-domain-containing protein [Punctularia strigosozonata HHB-11173 SS5]
MASSVFYRFKSQKNDSRVTFDGTGISVFDLKKEIILANNLGKANDIDIAVSDASTGQELKDDAHVVARSSSVIVRRVPAPRNGRGGAARYLAGLAPAGGADAGSKPGAPAPMPWQNRGSMSKRFDGKEDHPPVQKQAPAPVVNNVTDSDEAAAMAAMFQAQTASWEETQEKMSQLVSRPSWRPVFATYIHRNPRGGGPSERGGRNSFNQRHQPDRPLPPSYVCYRCGQKGHWIQDCPTNNDKDYDHRPRIKRTTGIPRSFLKTVENPNDGQHTQGVMVTPEGGYVVAQPDIASWQKQVAKPKALTEAEIRERTPTDPAVTCSIDNKLFKDAVKTPCCGTTFCEECIQTHLLERDFICPSCGKKIQSLDKLIPDKPTRTKVGEYIHKAIEDSKREDGEPQSSNAGKSAATGDTNTANADNAPQEGDIYAQQTDEPDMPQIIVDSIPGLQAQLHQLSTMLQNPALPHPVRQTTEMQYNQLQMQLQQAQTIAAALEVNKAAAAASFASMQQQMQQQMQPMMQPWAAAAYASQQAVAQDSPYQRLPVNNRRRNLKRERPSDFVEVAGSEGDPKQARYWE